jgi:hypothetical protein
VVPPSQSSTLSVGLRPKSILDGHADSGCRKMLRSVSRNPAMYALALPKFTGSAGTDNYNFCNKKPKSATGLRNAARRRYDRTDRLFSARGEAVDFDQPTYLNTMSDVREARSPGASACFSDSG